MIEFFEFWGIELGTQENQYVGDCPFCGKEQHFFCDKQEPLWDCKVCGRSGNQYSFMTQWHEFHLEATGKKDLIPLAENRKLPVERLQEARIAYDDTTGYYLFPYHSFPGEKGGLSSLGRIDLEKGTVVFKPVGIPSPLLFLTRKWNDNIVICEGEWDALAMQEMLELWAPDPDEWSVVAVPGANTFKDGWVNYFNGKRAAVFLDKDDSGKQGLVKIIQKLIGPTNGSVDAFIWPEDVEFLSAKGDKPGKDLRDYYVHAVEKDLPVKEGWSFLTDNLVVANALDSIEGDYLEDRHKLPEIANITSWEELIGILNEHLYMTSLTPHVVAVLFATQLSQHYPGEPIWVFLVGPASSGKTTLIEAFGINNVYCEAHSELHAKLLSSGMRSKSGKDPSLLPKLNRRCLMIKDYTTVLSMGSHNQDELYAILRDAFDGSFRKQYGNQQERNYSNLKFSMICGVTNAIHRDNRSSLGERFIKVNYLDEEFDEREHILRALGGAEKKEIRSKVLQQSMLGYLHYLIQNKPDHLPFIPRDYEYKLGSLAILVAYLRAQVERRTDDSLMYRPAREIASRLSVIFGKVSQCLMIVLGKKSVDEEVYSIVRHIAFSSCIPFNYEFAAFLYNEGRPVTRREIQAKMQIPSSNCHRILADLMQLRIAVMSHTKPTKGRPAELYSLHPELETLWEDAIVQGYRGSIRRRKKKVNAAPSTNGSVRRKKKKKVNI